MNWLLTWIYPTFILQEAQFSFPDQVPVSHKTQTCWDMENRRSSGKTISNLQNHSSLDLSGFPRKMNSHFLEQKTIIVQKPKNCTGRRHWCVKFPYLQRLASIPCEKKKGIRDRNVIKDLIWKLPGHKPCSKIHCVN